MPTVNPLPPTTPTTPGTGTGPTAFPAGTAKPWPTSVPVNVPGRAPQPAPSPQPAMVGILIYVEANERGRCILGSRDPNFRKPVPRKDSKPVRRQRPCQGGKPQRRVKRVKIKIGRFEIEKGRSFLTFIGVDPVKNGAATVAFEAGYDRDEKGKVVTIIAELDRPRGFRETLLDRLFKGQLCFYQVYAIEPRNKCTCPDGSPCRSTTRKD